LLGDPPRLLAYRLAGELVLELRHRHEPELAEQLLDRVAAGFAELDGQRGNAVVSASDFPASGISAEELRGLLSSLEQS
jgi:hypothetical protein